MSKINPPEIDWNAVRLKLTLDQAALESVLEPKPEQLAKIYDERARRYAARLDDSGKSAAAEPTRPLLVFRLGDEQYGIQLGEVAMVLPVRKMNLVPGASAEILGVVAVQGEVHVVLSLARILNVPESVKSAHEYMLVLKHERLRIGVAVDIVVGVQQAQSATAPTSAEGHALARLEHSDPVAIITAREIFENPLFEKGASRAPGAKNK
jgi:chemotaxis signal transduction protein